MFEKRKKNKKNHNEAEDEDVVFEESENAPLSIKELKNKLKRCAKEKQEYLTGWQRARADFVNLQNKITDEKKAFFLKAEEEFVTDLLPVIDSFEMAFSNKETWEKVSPDWRMGVELIYSNLLRTLKQHGVEELNPIGENFDPRVHTSVALIKTDNKDTDGKVLEVIQKGYIMRNTIIRSPQVKVAECAARNKDV